MDKRILHRIIIFLIVLSAKHSVFAQNCQNSFLFDGTYSTCVRIDPKNGATWNQLYSTSGFTWECWLNIGNRTNVQNTEAVVVASDKNYCEDIGFFFNFDWAGPGTFGFCASGQYGCSAPHNIASTTMTFYQNTWYHAAGVMDYSANEIRLYINGALVATSPLTLTMSQRMQNAVAVSIGNIDVSNNPYWPNVPFSGMIDEVRFWNKVKTQTEISAQMNSCLPPNTSNLVAYFKGDEGSDTFTSSSINANFKGVLVNNASWGTQVPNVNCSSISSVTISGDSTICDSTKPKTLTATSIPAGATFTWNNPTSTGPTKTIKFPGTYTVTASLNGCTTTASKQITHHCDTSHSKANTYFPNTTEVTLEQNKPNPFDNSTAINYQIPFHAKTAYLTISTLDGKTIQSIKIKERGKGVIHIHASEYTNGLYIYSLNIDGVALETKRMTILK